MEVEDLFRLHTVEEIHEIERQAKLDITHKQEELRQLVGARYRDVIESADTIVAMQARARNLVDISDSLSSKFAALKQSLNKCSELKGIERPASRKASLSSGKTESFTDALRALMEAPEKIWRYLDNNRFLQATKCYISCRNIHNTLTERLRTASSSESQQLHQEEQQQHTAPSDWRAHVDLLPIASQQWDSIKAYPSYISQAAKRCLLRWGLPESEYIEALGALVVLEQLSTDKALELFLAHRAELIDSVIDQSQALSSSVEHTHLKDFEDSICGLLLSVKWTLLLIYVFFVDNSRETATAGSPVQPLLQSSLAVSSSGEPLATFTPIPLETLHNRCASWLASCEKKIHDAMHLLLGKFRNGQPLADLDKALDERLSQSHDESASGVDSLWNSPLMWQKVCESLLRRDVNIQDMFYRPEWMARAGSTIEASFASLSFQEALQSALAPLRENMLRKKTNSAFSSSSSQLTVYSDGKDILEPDARFRTEHLAFILSKSPVHIVGQSREEEAATATATASRTTVKGSTVKAATAGSTVGSSMSTNHIYSTLDTQLQTILTDLQILVDSQLNRPSLREHLLDTMRTQCVSNMNRIAAEHQSKLDQLAESIQAIFSRDTATATTNDQRLLPVLLEEALYIGRVFQTLSAHSPALNSLLTRPTDSQQVRAALLQTTQSAYQLWVRYSTLQESRYFNGHLTQLVTPSASSASSASSSSSSSSLSSSVVALRDVCVKSMWVVTTWQGEGEAGEQVEDSVKLPAHVSPYVLFYLFHFAYEIHRASGRQIDQSLLVELKKGLLESLVGSYSSVLDSSLNQLSESVKIQIWFDMTFLAEVLCPQQAFFASSSVSKAGSTSESGSANGSTTTQPSAESSMLASASKLLQCIRMVKEDIDPVDWAAYDSVLKSRVKQQLQRCAVMLGALSSRSFSTEADTSATGATVAHNILPLVQPAVRFTLLPTASGLLPVQPGINSSIQNVNQAYIPQRTGMMAGRGAEDKTSSARSFMEQMGGRIAGALNKGSTGVTATSLGDMLQKGTTSLFSKLGSDRKK